MSVLLFFLLPPLLPPVKFFGGTILPTYQSLIRKDIDNRARVRLLAKGTILSSGELVRKGNVRRMGLILLFGVDSYRRFRYPVMYRVRERSTQRLRERSVSPATYEFDDGWAEPEKLVLQRGQAAAAYA